MNHELILKYRIGALIFCLGWTTVLLINNERGLFFLMFLTNWNWLLNNVYFLVATLQSYSKNTKYNSLYTIVFSITLPISMIVFCVFWTLLTNVVFGPNKSTWRRIQPTISHTLNLLLPLLDVIFSDTPVHWPLTTYPVIFILFYGMTIMFCHTVFGSPWPYPFLDRLNNYSNSISWVPMLLFGVFLVVLVLTFWFIVQKMTLKVQVVREKRVEKANMKETVTIV